MAKTKYATTTVKQSRKKDTVDRHTYLQNARANALRGKELPQTKLTDDDVSEIRSTKRQRELLLKHIRDNLSNDAIAKKFGVSVRAIERVMSYETHGNVE